MPRPNTKEKADALLSKAGITKPPVPILKLAEAAGVVVRLGPLPDDLSGFLVYEKGAAIIGVNSLHPKPRQAFTIAHELGHHALHPSTNFVDRTMLFFRNTRSSAAVDPDEIHANRFAAELLMPERFLNRSLRGEMVDLEDEVKLEELAKLFGVSLQALMYRLINLNLARHQA